MTRTSGDRPVRWAITRAAWLISTGSTSAMRCSHSRQNAYRKRKTNVSSTSSISLPEAYSPMTRSSFWPWASADRRYAPSTALAARASRVAACGSGGWSQDP
jgi:hypothetical protein